MPNISINQSDSSERDFFSRFGEYESIRQKRKQELVNDYRQYLRLEEQKFKDRFAHKKLTSTTEIYPLPEFAPRGTSEELSSRSYVDHDQHSEVTPNSRVLRKLREVVEDSNSVACFEANLEERLREIERKIENVNFNLQSTLGHNHMIPRTPHSNDDVSATSGKTHVTYDSGRHSVSANPSEPIKNNPQSCDFGLPDTNYEIALKQRLEMISEAEKRLVSLEDEYRRVKNLQNAHHLKVRDTSTQPIDSTSQNLGLSIAAPDSEAKLRQQERYRLELEAQIAELKKRRELEKAANNSNDDNKHLTTISSSIQKPYQTNSETDYFVTGNKELIQSKLSRTVALDRSDNQSVSTMTCIGSRPGDTNNEKVKKQQYADELKKQIEEARLRKEKIKKENDEYNRKLDLQLMSYDPHYASERQINEKATDNGLNSTFTHPSLLRNSNYASSTGPNEQSFARGGHGIFGSPLTEAQKSSLQHYKEELSKQIAEKQRIMELERQKEMEIERKEIKRIEEERIRMQKEFEAEVAKRKSKQEEERRATEANAKVEQSKKLEKEAKAEKKKSHQKEDRSKIMEKPKPSKPVRVERSKELKSPELLIGPELTLPKDKISQPKQLKTVEPDKKAETVLQQLNSLRSQLELEKKRVESVLFNARRSSVYDPRIVGKSHPKVDKQARKLFNNNQSHRNNNANVDEPEDYMELDAAQYITNDIAFWESMVQKDHAVKVIDEKQKAYLRAQDKYLYDLQADLDQFNAENRVHKSKYTRDKKLHMSERESLQSNESIDLIGLNQRNQQRIKTLEAMQLLNDVDTDPEMILERFISKHDELYPNMAKANLY